MYRTFCGSVECLKNVIVATLAGRTVPPVDVNILVLTGNSFDSEFPLLSKLTRMGNYITLKYERTQDRHLPNLAQAQILWVGQSEIKQGDNYFFDPVIEDNIKNFVHNGGMVIVSGQDSTAANPCPTGWIPEPLLGVESKQNDDFQIPSIAFNLFKAPNLIKKERISLGDTWTKWGEKYDILATTNNGKDIVIAKLECGKGMYLVTGLQNKTEEEVKINADIMENLIHYAVRWTLRKTP
jgi:hypothetical protein